MKFIADFHIHSKYSRATSKDMDIENISKWARLKGVDLIGTGDFTHPLWFSELKNKLKDDGNGLFSHNGTKFMLTTEICNIFHQDEKLRKVHSMVFCPSFEAAEKISRDLGRLASLMSDGRPILTIPIKKVAEIVFSASSECLFVPCHIWTPWFSLFGANSGFDSIEECFGEYSRNIHAAETGLSSDPQMNWRLSSLDRICLISNSDAHSPSKIGREANVFDTELSYKGIIETIKEKDPKRFLFTVEFFPEEGKYHYDGHRNCKVSMPPGETKKKRKKCPACGKPVTVGVMHRVEELSDRAEGYIPEKAIPFKKLVPLQEIIAEVLDKGVETAAVKNEYMRLVTAYGSEFKILMDAPIGELSRGVPENILEGIARVREGRINILPGYDGEYGTIKLFDEPASKKTAQISLF